MSPGQSALTVLVAFRVPASVAVVLARRAKKAHLPAGEYIRRRVVYDTTRKHGK